LVLGLACVEERHSDSPAVPPPFNIASLGSATNLDPSA
jgi:hypothetical protein